MMARAVAGRAALAAGLAMCAGQPMLAGQAFAAQPIPLKAGTYCGPGDAKIIVDVDKDQVTIDKMVCSFPVIAADRIQSDLCSTPQGAGTRQNLDFRVIGRTFLHGGAVYRFCGPVQAGG